MKKIFSKITSLIITVALMLTVMSGCDLVSVNTDRDMAQVVAKVSIDGELSDTIYKKDMVAAYNSYGYYYAYYYSYTQKQTYEMIIDNLISNAIILQQAKKGLTGPADILGNTEKGFFKQADESSDKTSIEETLSGKNYEGKAFTSLTKKDANEAFMTEYEYYYSRYAALLSVDSLINTYIDKEVTDAPIYETYTVTARPTLTVEEDEDEANEYELKSDEVKSVVDDEYYDKMKVLAKEVKITLKDKADYTSKYDLNMDVYKKYIDAFDITSKERRNALGKVIKALSKNGLVSEKEVMGATPKTVDALFEIGYFKDLLESQYKSSIVTKYSNAITNSVEKEFNSDTLYAEYVSLYNKQKAEYSSNVTAYETALEGVGDDTFVVYNPNYESGKYGYVANLLIGFDDYATELLEAKSGEANIKQSEIKAYRETLLKNIQAKDLRATWVLNNYGKYDGDKFVFDGDYVKTEALKEFKGSVDGAKSYLTLNSDNVVETKYNFANVKGNAVAFDDFYGLVSNVMGFDSALNYGEFGKVAMSDEKLTAFRDLIYAYSTDDGSLAENFGYVYSPFTSAGKYVEEFATAAKQLVEMGEGSYSVVATDFGYHIMFCTKVINPSETANVMEKAEFVTGLSEKGSFAYKYKQYKQDLVVSNEVDARVSSFTNNHLGDKYVTRYEDAYEDLLVE